MVKVVAISLVAGFVCAGPALGFERGADGDFEKRTSSHFVLYQDVDIDQTSGLRGSRRFEQDVLETLEEGYDRLDTLLGLRPRRPIQVVVYDPNVFAQRFDGIFRFTAAGFYNDSVHIRGDTRVTPHLMSVLQHELVHAAFHAEAPSMVLPAWLNEGLAEWLAARAVGKRYLSPRESQRLSAAAAQGSLFTLGDLSTRTLGHLGPGAAGLAYLQSYAFFDYLSHAYGDRSLRELVDRLLRTGDLQRSFRNTYRADLGKLEGRFADSLRG